jgi:hypothetical protein
VIVSIKGQHDLLLSTQEAAAERFGLYDADSEDVRAALRAARKKPEG